MWRFLWDCLGACAWISLLALPPAKAQPQEATTAELSRLSFEGFKSFSGDQLVALSKLEIGSQVGKADLQAAADRLLQTGLFTKVDYNYTTRSEGIFVTFRLVEAPRVPAYFDNMPWFSDGELANAIKKKLPFFDGTLPEGGAVVDQATEAVTELLSSHKLDVTTEHQFLANPIGDDHVQEFHIEGPALHIGKVEFGDPALASSHTVQQQLSDVVGKPYSRMTIDLFLAEQVRPLYLAQGFLRVKLGPPEIRLTGNPNLPLPDQLPVFIPIATGAVYHWKDAQWSGNNVLSTITLAGDIGLKPDDVADGMKIEGGWDRIREDYGHRGYLDAKVEPVPSYDDQAHTIAYTVTVAEGSPYRYNTMVLTGISLADERRLREVWPIKQGDVFDKAMYEDFLLKLQNHRAQIFGDLPVHYDTVGHWLRPDAEKHVIDVLLDFK